MYILFISMNYITITICARYLLKTYMKKTTLPVYNHANFFSCTSLSKIRLEATMITSGFLWWNSDNLLYQQEAIPLWSEYDSSYPSMPTGSAPLES